MWVRRVVTAFVAISLLSGALAFVSTPAQAAASNDQLFWVGSTASPAVTDGLYGSTASTVPSATRLGSNAGLYRSIATDGTYIYFSDGTNLVRTATDGTGKTTVVTGVVYPEQITVAGNYLYYTLYNGGVYGVSLSGSLPASANLIFTVAGGGWNGVTVSGSTIYAINNSGSGSQGIQGLYSATLNGINAVTATMIDASAVMTHSASKIYASSGNIYAAGSTGAIKVRDSSGVWTSVSLGGATGQSVYSVSVVDTTIYFTTGTAIGSVGTSGASPTILNSGSQFTSVWSVAAASPAMFTVIYNGNGNTGGAVPTDASSPYVNGSTVTVLDNTGSLTKPDNQFLSWNTAANGTGTWRAVGSTFTITQNTTLYAQWAGGPLAYSLSPGGPIVTTAAFPQTLFGQTSTLTVYLRNTGALVYLGTPVSGVGAPTSNTCPSGSSNDFAKNAECHLTLSWVANTDLASQVSYPYGGPSTATLALTGTMVNAARTPTFSVPVATANGYTVNVTNWNNSWSWTPTVSAGSVVAGTGAGSTLPLTVSGLASSASATITMSATRSTYLTGTATVTGTAQPGSGGGGGGGSTPAETTQTPSTPPIVTPSTPNPLGPQDSPTANALQPGGTVVTVGGKQAPTTTTSVPKTGSVDGSGEGWTVAISGRTPSGGIEPLTSTGGVQIPQGGGVHVNGSGYQPGTQVMVYALNPALLLGTFTVGADGAYSGTVTLPASINAGNAVIQVNGFASLGVVRSYSLGVKVVKNATVKTQKRSTTVYFAAGSSWLNPAARAALAKAAKSVPRGAASVSVVSTGYVQATPDISNDYTLSTARATNAASALKANHLAGKYYVTGRGIAKESGAKARKVIVEITYTVK